MTRFLRDVLGGRYMHCTLRLTQGLQGTCLSHLIFWSEQRIQANLGLVEDVLVEGAGESMM